MQLMIEINEEDYNIMKHNIAVNNPLCPLSQEEMVFKVANGTPLPEHHGRIADQESCEDEYIKVPKKALKYRTAEIVAYNVEWLKKHFDIERAVLFGELAESEAIDEQTKI